MRRYADIVCAFFGGANLMHGIDNAEWAGVLIGLLGLAAALLPWPRSWANR